MSEQNGKVVGSETIRRAACISAAPEDHIKFAQNYIDLGFDHLIFHSAGPDQRAFLEGYGRDVLPQLRERSRMRSESSAARR
jgi:coenzyme F420-dependent glucose-6-phosphate dehydrogenase